MDFSKSTEFGGKLRNSEASRTLDGKDLSNKVLFNSKLNKQVEDELVGEGKVSVIRIDMSDILEKTNYWCHGIYKVRGWHRPCRGRTVPR